MLSFTVSVSVGGWTVLLAHPDNKVSKTATIISIRFIGRPPLISYLYCMNATYLFQMCHIFFFSDSTVSLLRSGGSVRGENQNSTDKRVHFSLGVGLILHHHDLSAVPDIGDNTQALSLYNHRFYHKEHWQGYTSLHLRI